MTTPYVDPQTVHNPATGTSPPASWGDTVRDNQQYFSTPPSVKAVRTALLSIANNTQVALTLNATDEWDTDSLHSTTSNTSRITIPAGLGGKYHLIGNVFFGTGATGARSIEIRKNGSVDLSTIQTDSAVGNWTGTNAVLSKLAAGDYVELICFQFTGAAVNVNGSFSAHWVSL